MGNNQSQSTDEEDEQPTYHYHEDVLRNAQLLTGSQGSAQIESDEEFFSADEDNESDRSITPPRTRPESSSGEEFTDDQSEEYDGDEQAAVRTSPTILYLPTSMEPGRILRGHQSCGRCNMSRFEEQDSISPELETSRWHLNDSSFLPTRPSIDNSRALHATEASSFVPIQYPPIVALQNSRNDHELNQHKRKSSNSPKDKRVPPKKRYSSEVSPWKRGIGYFDSSDSDEDVEERSASLSPRSKRLKGVHHALSPRKRASEPVLYDGNLVSHPKQKRLVNKRALADVISISPKRSFSGGKSDLENMSKRVKAMNDCNSGIPPDGNENSPNFSSQQSVSSNSKRMTLRSSAFVPHKDEGDGNFIKRGRIIQTNTSKMGNSGVRNSFGKLVPLRSQADTQSKTQSNTLNEGERTKSIASPVSESRDLSSLTNIVNNLRDGRLKRKAEDKLSPLSFSVSNLSNNASFQNMNDEAKQETTSHTQTRLDFNPLANVVLTPNRPGNIQLFGEEITDSNSTSKSVEAQKKGKSAAERFKQFWTGTSFKSIFANKLKHSPKNSQQLSNLHFQGDNNSSSSLFNNSTHVHFSSSPASTSSHIQPLDPPFTNHSAPKLSPIFASLPPSDSQANTTMSPINKDAQRYSSILEMSISKVHKKGTVQDNSLCL